MAVVRYKNNEFSFDKKIGNAIIKSGSTSRVHSDTIKDYTLYHSFFYNEDAFNRNGFLAGEKIKNPFNDDNTIIFENKDIVPTYGIESKYFNSAIKTLENNLKHTPNIFYGTSDTKNVNVKREKYNKFLIPNYIRESSNETISFDEKDNITGSDVKNVLDFEFNLHTPCILSLNKNQNISSTIGFLDNENNVVRFNRHNGNSVYLYGKSTENALGNGFNSFDYIGNIANNYFTSINQFKDIPLMFMCPAKGSVDQLGIISTSSIPNDTFNFPYDNKFKAENRHCVDMSDYILKPFVIEKIYIEATISNYAQNAKENASCLNYLNFFILNQSHHLSYEDVSIDNNIIFSLDNTTLQTDTNLPDFVTQPIYSSAEAPTNPAAILNKTETLSNSLFTIDSSNGNSVYSNERNNNVYTREIISYGTVTNFGIKSSDEEQYVNVKNSLEKYSDYLNYITQENSNNIELYNECIFTNRKISFEITPRIVNKNNSLPNISDFNVFPEKKSSSACGLEIKSNRFFHNDKNINSQNLSGNSFDVIGKTVDINNEEYKESQYLVLPNDKIIFGVSLSPNLRKTGDIDECVVVLHDKIRISFSGYYLENNNKKYYKTQQYNFRNSKKFGNVYNRVCDDFGKPENILQKKMYNNNNFVGIAGETLQSQNILTQGIRSAYLTLPNSETYNSNLYNDYKILNDNEKSYFKHYFNTSRYGHFSDFIKYNCNSKYYEASTNSIINCINKKFKNGYFINKNPGEVTGSLIFDFSSIANYNIPNRNWLKDKMFFKYTPYVRIFESVAQETIDLQDPGSGFILLPTIVEYAQKSIDIMLFDLEDNLGKKYHYLVRLVEPQYIFGTSQSNNYFINSGGSIDSYSTNAKRLKNYQNTDEDYTFIIIDIPNSITDTFNTDANGIFTVEPDIDSFLIALKEGINATKTEVFTSYDLDVTASSNSGMASTRLILKDEFEGFYDTQYIELQDANLNALRFEFDATSSVYTDESLISGGVDPVTNINIIRVGIQDSSGNQKESKINQLKSLQYAINNSTLDLKATISYESEFELFIAQEIPGNEGNTDVVTFFNITISNPVSFILENFSDGGHLRNYYFKSQIEAELEEITNPVNRTINLKNLTRGKIGNSNINSGTASNVDKENFSIVEGHIINSYNADNNASVSNENLIFRER